MCTKRAVARASVGGRASVFTARGRFGAVLSAAFCSMCFRNFPLNVMTTRSPPLPYCLADRHVEVVALMMPSPNFSLMSSLSVLP